MKGPNVKTLEKVKALKEEISAKYEELEKITNEIIKKHGIGEWLFENEDGTFTRFSTVDNLRSLEESGTIFKAASLKRFDLQIKELKRKPKDYE